MPDFFTYAAKEVDGREICVLPLLTGTARLTVGPPGAGWYEDSY
jgi:hypothetical protein